jgi:ABC-type bacteriocin/lantibiotic exporter with double-glycine peptidase domain
MVLAFLGRNESYGRLTQLLGTRWFGTPARNILRLEQIGLRVSLIELDITEIETHLQNGRPVIAFVSTADLPYWNVNTDHAVVVIGADEENIFLNDPYFANAPQSVSRTAFELSLLRFNNQCVIIEK